MTDTQVNEWVARMEAERKDSLAMEAHDKLMEEIRIENEAMSARMELYPNAVYGGDGAWNNYGE